MVMYGGMAGRGIAPRRPRRRGGVPRDDPSWLGAARTACSAGCSPPRSSPTPRKSRWSGWTSCSGRPPTPRTPSAAGSRATRSTSRTLLPEIAVPALVLHARGDRVAPDVGPRWPPTSRTRGWCCSSRATTCCSPTSRRGRCSATRSPASSRPDRVSVPVDRLSDREREILLLAGRGPRQQRDRGPTDAERADRRASLPERLPQARPLRALRARAAAVARMLA